MRLQLLKFLIFLLVFSLILPSNAAHPNAEGLQPGEFLKHWLILKPIPVTVANGKVPDEAAQKQAFARDWLLDKGGEARVQPRAGMKTKIAGHTLKWQPLESGSGVFFVADNAHPMDYAITYAWTEFNVPEKQTAILGIGSDEGVKVWLNGKLVHEHWINRGVRVDDDLVAVELQAGKNQLLLKVQNSFAPSGFACRLLSEEQAQNQKLFRAHMEATGANTLTDAEIKTMLRDSIDTDKQTVGLAVGIVDEHGPRVISHGKLDNGTDREVDGDTLFEIGSITKVFTALLLQDMLERGEMKLNDPVQKYLPDSVRMPTWQGKEITLLHLATHTSGLPRDSNGGLYAFLSHCTLQQAPGVRWEYSNLGMGLLGHAIALKAGKDYETLVIERICQPLGMDGTRITLSPELKARLAIGHGMPGHRVRYSAQNHDTNSRAPRLLGAGSLRSTANDLLKFVSAYAGLTPSPLSSLMQKAEALHTLESGAKRPLVWLEHGDIFEHGGATAGYETALAFDVKRRRGIVVLSNCRGSSILPEIWRPLLAGRSAKPTSVMPMDAACYDRYVGQYQSDQGGICTVRRQGERLIVQWVGKPDERLRNASFEVFPQSESVFCNEFWGSQAIFLPAADGQPLKTVLTSWGWQGSVEVTKISTEVPEPPAPVHVDSSIYDRYVGQYRKTFLFGLIRIGPTLSISHQKDELSDLLIGRVRGLPGQNVSELFPISETSFIVTPGGDDLQLTFVPNKQGKVTHVLVNWNGRRICGTRTSNEPAK